MGERLSVAGILFDDSTALSFGRYSILYSYAIYMQKSTYFEYTTDEPLIERLSVSVLNVLETVPAFGYKLVPEHVETRSLFREDRPGLEQVCYRIISIVKVDIHYRKQLPHSTGQTTNVAGNW